MMEWRVRGGEKARVDEKFTPNVFVIFHDDVLSLCLCDVRVLLYAMSKGSTRRIGKTAVNTTATFSSFSPPANPSSSRLHHRLPVCGVAKFHFQRCEPLLGLMETAGSKIRC